LPVSEGRPFPGLDLAETFSKGKGEARACGGLLPLYASQPAGL
jgi:hypothetical protein